MNIWIIFLCVSNVYILETSGACYSNKMYKSFNTFLSYGQAERHCRESGYHLVRPLSQYELKYIIKKMMNGADFWIDGYTSGRQHSWSDGSTVQWTNWGSRPASIGQCVVARGRDGQWFGQSCSHKQAFICEKPLTFRHYWTSWTHWSACSSVCGGKRTRSMSCVNSGRSSPGTCCSCPVGEDCKVIPRMSQPCTPCPINGAWSPWSAFSRCSSLCNGYKARTRTCTSPAPAFNGKPCSPKNGSIEKVACAPCLGNISSQLNAVEPGLFKPLSWYDLPELIPTARACFLKVDIQNAPPDTYFTAVSRSAFSTEYGNYTAGPRDQNLGFTGPLRTACLQFRCPSTVGPSRRYTTVSVFPSTSSRTCTVKSTNNLLSGYTYGSHNGQAVIKFAFNVNYNYGADYGVYIDNGKRFEALNLAEYHCQSGTSDAYVNVVMPGLNSAATFACS